MEEPALTLDLLFPQQRTVLSRYFRLVLQIPKCMYLLQNGYKVIRKTTLEGKLQDVVSLKKRNGASFREQEDGRVGLGGGQRSSCLPVRSVYMQGCCGEGVHKKPPSLGLTNYVYSQAEMRGLREMSLPSRCSHHLDNRDLRISSSPLISLGPPVPPIWSLS